MVCYVLSGSSRSLRIGGRTTILLPAGGSYGYRVRQRASGRRPGWNSFEHALLAGTDRRHGSASCVRCPAPMSRQSWSGRRDDWHRRSNTRDRGITKATSVTYDIGRKRTRVEVTKNLTLTPKNFQLRWQRALRCPSHARIRTRMVRPFSIRVCLFAEERATINKGTSCRARRMRSSISSSAISPALLIGRRWLGSILDNLSARGIAVFPVPEAPDIAGAKAEGLRITGSKSKSNGSHGESRMD